MRDEGGRHGAAQLPPPKFSNVHEATAYGRMLKVPPWRCHNSLPRPQAFGPWPLWALQRSASAAQAPVAAHGAAVGVRQSRHMRCAVCHAAPYATQLQAARGGQEARGQAARGARAHLEAARRRARLLAPTARARCARAHPHPPLDPPRPPHPHASRPRPPTPHRPVPPARFDACAPSPGLTCRRALHTPCRWAAAGSQGGERPPRATRPAAPARHPASPCLDRPTTARCGLRAWRVRGASPERGAGTGSGSDDTELLRNCYKWWPAQRGVSGRKRTEAGGDRRWCMVRGGGRGAGVSSAIWGGVGEGARPERDKGDKCRAEHVSCDVSPKRGIHTRAVGLVRRRTSV